MTRAIFLGSRDRSRPDSNASSAAGRAAVMLGIVGGALSTIGAWMPWLSFFAGLQPVSGLSGPSGWAIAALGGVAVAGSVLGLLRNGALGRLISGLAGFGVLAVSGWAAVGLVAKANELAQDPLIVSALEPGLLVALIGGAMAFAVLFVPVPTAALDPVTAAPSQGGPETATT